MRYFSPVPHPTLLNMLYNKHPSIVTKHLCSHSHEFNTEFLKAAAKEKRLVLPQHASKREICDALQDAVGYVVLEPVIKIVNVIKVMIPSISSNQYLTAITAGLIEDSEDVVMQYLLAVEQPELQDFVEISRKEFGKGGWNLMIARLSQLIDKYSLTRTVLSGIIAGRAFSLNRWFAGKLPPYWVSSQRAKSDAAQLFPILQSILDKAGALLSLMERSGASH